MIAAAWFLVPVVLIGPAADAPPPGAEQLETLYRRLLGPTAADRLAAAGEIAALPPSGLELYAQRLRRPRTASPATLRQEVLEIWAQVPDPDYPKSGRLWISKPEPPWKPPPLKKGQPRPRRPPPHDPEKVDWIAALAELDLDANPALKDLGDRAEARAQAIEAVALLHAIAAAGRAGEPAAVEPMFDFAFDLEGVFRDECGRAIRSMDSPALPGLIRRMRQAPTKELKGLPLFRMKRYASYQLDRMDRAQPRKAISTAPDDRLRAAIIHAYGEVRALDAVEAILEQIDAPSHRVREEARWAWLRYVTGPPPPDAPKRKRKLPGGKAESEEKEDYLNYRQMAVLALNRVLREIEGDKSCTSCAKLDEDGKPPPRVDAKKMTDVVFAFYDRRRDAAWDAEWNAARQKVVTGDLAGAIAEFSFILAHDPSYERRGEMAATYYERGRRLLDEDPAAAAAILRQAIALDPASPQASWAEARVLFADASERLAAGVPDPEAFRRAATLDPSLVEARTVLARFEAGRNRRRLFEQSGTVAAMLAAVCVAGAIVLLLGRRRRST